MPDSVTTPTSAAAAAPAVVEPASKEVKSDAVVSVKASASAALDKHLLSLVSGKDELTTTGDSKETPVVVKEATTDQPLKPSAENGAQGNEPKVEFGDGEKKPAVATDEDEYKGGFPADWPQAAVKNLLKEREKRKEARRVADESTAKLTAAETRARELSDEVAKLKQAQPSREASATPALLKLTTPQDIAAYRAAQQALRDDCELYADGYPQFDDKGKPVLDDDGKPVLKFTRQQVAAIKVQAIRELEHNIPAREQFITDKAKWESATEQRYPWLGNETSKAAAEVRRIEENWDSIANGPARRRMIVWALRGRELEHNEDAARTSAPEVKPPVVPARSAAERPTPTKDDKRDARKQAATAAIRAGKGKAALQDFLAVHFNEDEG